MSNYPLRGRPRAVRLMGRALVVLAAAIALTGCAGNEPSMESEQAAPARPAVGQDRQAVAESGGAGSGSADAGDAAATAEQAGKDVKIAPEDRALVYTAELTVRADDVATAADKAKRLVNAAGGYVAEERLDSTGGESSGTLVLKVPPDRYPTVLAQLGTDLG